MNPKYPGILSILLTIHLSIHHCEIITNELDYIALKEIPGALHNDNINLTVLYRCSSAGRRAISLSIDVERTLFQTKVSVFRRHWYCEATPHIRSRSIPIRLPRSVAYASDNRSNFHSWPVEQARLYLLMFDNEQRDQNQIVKQVQYDIRFLPVHQRPKMYSERWTPLKNKVKDEYCSPQPEVVKLVNYPLVLTGGAYGKHVILPSFTDYTLRWKQAVQSARPKFSVVFWIYIEEYCSDEIEAEFCSILQHVTFNNSHLSPEFFFDREGHLMIYMFGYLYDPVGTGARTADPFPKKDWCRVVFVVDEDTWTLYISCRATWHTALIIPQKVSIPYHYTDQIGTFLIGGNNHRPSFRGMIGQLTIYRHIALHHEQLPKNLYNAEPRFLPEKVSEIAECVDYLSSFEQYRTQLHLLRKRIQKRNTCSASPFSSTTTTSQCLLIGTWKRQFNSISSEDLHYRIFRALRRGTMHSKDDLAQKLYRLAVDLLTPDYSAQSCQRALRWLEQATCYEHLGAQSLLATFHQFGLCGLTPNRDLTLDLLLDGALRKDRISLLALGHRHYYGLDGVPQDYDAAYSYYQHVAIISKHEIDRPKAGEVSFHRIRLTSDALDNQVDVFNWLRDQARRGVASAQHSVGIFLYNGGQGIDRDIPVALRYFRSAANQNDARSLFLYGFSRLIGNGIEKNETGGLLDIEEAVRLGCHYGLNILGKYAYYSKKNYTKAAHYWQKGYNDTRDIHCAYHLGVMWTAGHHPPTFQQDYNQALTYHTFAALGGQIDSASLLASYFALGGHPTLLRNSEYSASWARYAADENSAIATIIDRALVAYHDKRWEAAFLFYLQAALAGIELGYYNAGYLCHDLKVSYGKPIDCVDQLFQMSLMKREVNLRNVSHDLLVVADYYQSKNETLNKSVELYIQLFQQGEPRGLFGLAEMEEKNGLIASNIWEQLGVKFENKILKDKYRRLQVIYQYCQAMTGPKRDESYVPCTLAYFKISIKIFLTEHYSIAATVIFLTISVIAFCLNLV